MELFYLCSEAKRWLAVRFAAQLICAFVFAYMQKVGLHFVPAGHGVKVYICVSECLKTYFAVEVTK